MNWNREPVFVLTSDIDWASEYCIEDLMDAGKAAGAVTTAFVTHESAELTRRAEAGEIHLGVHPNFLPGSSHGSDVQEVIDHVFELVPGARCFRSHAMVDSTPISIEMEKRGIAFDSNLALHVQQGLVPLSHWTGIPRYPVFWADDIHWRREPSWDFADYEDAFFTPGLKVISVHPFFFAMNIPGHDFYQAHKPLIQTLDAEAAEEVRFDGLGVRTFVLDLLAAIRRRGHALVSLEDVFAAGAPA